MKVLERFIKKEVALGKELKDKSWKTQHNQVMTLYELEDIYSGIINDINLLINYDEKHNWLSTQIKDYPFEVEQEKLERAFKKLLEIIQTVLPYFKKAKRIIRTYKSKINIKLLEEARIFCQNCIEDDDSWLVSPKMQKIFKQSQKDFESENFQPL